MKSFRDRLTHLRAFDHTAAELAFLLGGIGTGNVSVGARGQFRDWEIFNKPAKGRKFPYAFFAIHLRQGEKVLSRVLEAQVGPPWALSHGFDRSEMAGLPRFQRSVFRGEYPLCQVDLIDDALPVAVSMEAFTPFLPLNADDSSLPLAVIRYHVRNLSGDSLFVSVAGSMPNMTVCHEEGAAPAGETANAAFREGGLSGVLMESKGFGDQHPMRCSMALSTSGANTAVKPAWLSGFSFDSAQDFWNEFSSAGSLSPASEPAGQGGRLLEAGGPKVGSVAAFCRIPPGGEEMFEFFLTWHVPNRVLGWSQAYDPASPAETTRNYYALRYRDARAVAVDTFKRLPELEQMTLRFHDALFGSTLPDFVLDALASNITALRSPLCFRIGNGQFFGWEGCSDRAGCCDGSCTHVWNYEQTLAFLFPQLAQSMRWNEFSFETEEDGKMNFRSRKQLKDPAWDKPAAVDGQNGTIVRLYREWLLSGNDRLIDQLGEAALRALDYAPRRWDADGDGVLDSEQHNTYDIEFYGLNSLANTMYLAALKAGAEMAAYLGQEDRAAGYRRLLEKAGALLDRMLWTGEYYRQILEDIDRYKYQYGEGCLSDQILGQYLAHVCGMGYLLPKEHVGAAVRAIFRYNFRRGFREQESVQRTYCLGDDAGLLLCTWPHGGRPRFPLMYSDEVWTGIEYQVAASLIYEDAVQEGLEIVKAVRDRHDGKKRNPFDEVECGHHYARSMASWAVLIALSGYRYDLRHGRVDFSPKLNQEHFSCFYSHAGEWGVYTQKIGADGALVKRRTPIYRSPSAT